MLYEANPLSPFKSHTQIYIHKIILTISTNQIHSIHSTNMSILANTHLLTKALQFLTTLNPNRL